MTSTLKSLVRRAFYQSGLVRSMVGGLSVLTGRTRPAGLSHLLSYCDENAIGPLQRDEAIALFGIVKTLRPETVVEFGFFHGHSAFNFLQALPQDARLFSYDIDAESARRARDEFGFDSRFTFLEKSQTDFDPRDIGGRRMDFVFFDAAHELELNTSTFGKILPHLADDAVIAIHDTGLWHRSGLTPLHERFISEMPGEWVDETHYAHQPGERAFVDWITATHPEFAAIHFHSTRTLRHGFSLLQRQRRLRPSI
jgi:hypothetical protein